MNRRQASSTSHTRTPRSSKQPSQREWDIAPQPFINDTPDQRADAGAGLTAGHGATTNVLSLDLDVHDYPRRGYHPYSRSSSRHRQPDVSSGSSTSRGTAIQQGAFANAHNFTIGVAYLNDVSWTEEERGAEEERTTREEYRAAGERRAEEVRQATMVLAKLAEKGMPGAMLNSEERAYAPRCNEDTRQTVRTRIIEWARKDREIRRVLWLSGLAAVGKSAVAQTVAEQLKKEGLLGAVFFFSRPNNRSNPDGVIPTLIYQLVVLLPEYKHLVIRKLIENPLILKENRRSLFHDLIIEPFRILASQHPTTVQQPLVIVLDGLDECRDHKAQCEFVDIITHHVNSETSSCLRWIICSRPEPHLKVAFSRSDCRAISLEEKLEVDDNEARDDATRILYKGFAEIREMYPDQLTQDWPTEDQVRLIADRASGHLGFVSFILRFISDEVYGSPSTQLDVCIKFLERSSGPIDTNPLHALDLLYTQILSDIPANILPTTRRILGFFIYYDSDYLAVIVYANFLGLTQAAFYGALQRLHSVLVIPSVSEADEKCIWVYHTSFSDFLKDPARSGRFVLEEGVVPCFDIAISSLKWLNPTRKKSSDLGEWEFTWKPSERSRETVLGSLSKFSFTSCWEACPKVPKNLVPALVEALENFDFDLFYEQWSSEAQCFAYFIRWLVSLGTETTRLIVIKHWTKDFHHSENQQKLLVLHQDNDPSTFIGPFIEGATFVKGSTSSAEDYAICLQLGRFNPILINLKVTRWCSPCLA